MSEEEVIGKLTPSKIEKIIKNPKQVEKFADLVYINVCENPGITRKTVKDEFEYIYNNRKLKSKEQLNRIKKLAIPPAWEDVWICALENGHLQATGIDTKNRKQYRYHPVWNALRNHTKFYRMIQFAESLPKIRLVVENDLALKGLPLKKVLAAVISLMERTNIRVGNNTYEKLYGSFGLTTLKDKHVKFDKQSIKFSFIGKKGIKHDIELKNKRLAKIVQECKEIPGKELFQYYDEDNKHYSIDSGMINSYIKEISGEDFTAKDFRTWSGTVNAFLAFKEFGTCDDDKEIKKKVIDTLDVVASRLGNTRTVCKKYYVHPQIISMFENKTLQKYLDELDEISEPDGNADLTKEEKIILKILKGGN